MFFCRWREYSRIFLLRLLDLICEDELFLQKFSVAYPEIIRIECY